MRDLNVALLVFAFLTALGGCDTAMPQQPPTIHVPLGGKVAEARGLMWPVEDGGALSEMYAVETPCETTIGFPGGGVYVSESKCLVISQADGRIEHVRLAPLLHLVPFAKALQQAKRILSDLKLDQQALVKGHLEEWERRDPQFSVSTGGETNDGTHVFLELVPHANGDGWFINLIFDAPDKENKNSQAK